MSTTVTVIVLDDATSQAVYGLTPRPRLVRSGPEAGKMVVPASVLTSSSWIAHLAALQTLPQVVIDPAVAWTIVS